MPGYFTKVKTIQLAKPLLKVDSIFFQKSAIVELELNHPQVDFRFSDDGWEVSSDSKKYDKSFNVSSTQTIRAKAFHKDFLSSETVSIDLIKVNSLAANAEISMSPLPSDSYIGAGAKTLADFKKGSMNFKDGNWLGFQSEIVTIDFGFLKKEKIESVGISFLRNNDAWIFSPKVIEIWIGGKMVKSKELPPTQKGRKASFSYEPIFFPVEHTDQVSIKILNLSQIPDWHPGKGTPPWFFIDEVFFNFRQ